MPRPVADLIADYIPAAQCLKGNKVLLLQPFQYGQRLALEPGTEPLGQLLEGADPFARVDGVADAINDALTGAEVCKAAKHGIIKKAGAAACANAPVIYQTMDKLSVNPTTWIVHHLFNL